MGRSRDLQTDNIRIGFRFTENLAKELHQAVSAQSRGDRVVARRCWETAQQMLDTIQTETGIEEWLNGTSEVKARDTSVAAEGEPSASDSGAAKKDTKRDSTGERPSGGKQRSNKGTKRTPGAGRSGVPGTGDAK